MQASARNTQTEPTSGNCGGDLNAAEARNLAYLVSWRLSALEQPLMSAQILATEAAVELARDIAGRVGAGAASLISEEARKQLLRTP